MHGGAAGRDDALLELDDLLLAGLVLAFAGGDFDFQMVRVEEAAIATHDIDRRLGKDDATIMDVLGFVHYCGNVQECLRRDAADVETDPAERGVTLDDDGLEAEVGSAESRRVAAGAAAPAPASILINKVPSATLSPSLTSQIKTLICHKTKPVRQKLRFTFPEYQAIAALLESTIT